MSRMPSPAVVCITLAVTFASQVPIHLLTQGWDFRVALLLRLACGLVLPLGIVLRWKRYPVRRLFPWRGLFLGQWLAVGGLALAVAIGTDYLVALIDHLRQAAVPYRQTIAWLARIDSGTEWIERIALVCLLPAIIEEAYFRGFCQHALAARFGTTQGIGLTAFFFAVAHPHPVYLPLYFGLGCFLGWLAHRYRTLLAPILAHCVNNLWTLLQVANFPSH